MFDRYHILIGMITAVCLCSCSHRALEEAQVVVAEADSLWRAGKMYGIDEGDSATLAQAYETLGRFTKFSMVHSQLSTAYVHACYQYGRLLRRSDNPAEAMQVFIDATHTRTRDFHILGRVYSNMGSICHLAGDFPLSYDMYEKSANMFLKNGDTINYFYARNDMALELAEQGKKDSTLRIIHEIEKQCIDRDILNKTIETKAETYFKCMQLDSALCYANLFCAQEKYNSTGLLIKAQTFSLLHEQDSATYYANLVIEKSTSLYVIHNALYILTNDDSAKNIEDVRKTAADRSDVQKQLRVHQGKLSQAVQLLEQDLDRKPDWRWLYTCIGIVLCIVAAIILCYIWKKRKQHQQIILDIHEKEQLHTALVSDINNLSQIQEAHHNKISVEIENFCISMQSNPDIKKQLCWNNYDAMCESVNRYMYSIVVRLQPYHLSEKEMRLCILVLLKATTEQMTDMIPYAKSGLGKFKYSTARKLGTTTANMRSFILNLMG